jgi:hypothetical protein
VPPRAQLLAEVTERVGDAHSPAGLAEVRDLMASFA